MQSPPPRAKSSIVRLELRKIFTCFAVVLAVSLACNAMILRRHHGNDHDSYIRLPARRASPDGRRRQQQATVRAIVAVSADSSNGPGGSLIERAPDSMPSNAPQPRLELLHIPKTGGTLLEVLAARDASPPIAWGACHFDFPWKEHPTSEAGDDLRLCPPLGKGNHSSVDLLWHFPLQVLRKRIHLANDGSGGKDYYYGGANGGEDENGGGKVSGGTIGGEMEERQLTFNPYDNLPSAHYASRPKHYFIVVRNPYDRLLSLYYSIRGWRQPKNFNDPAKLNGWLQSKLRSQLDEYCHDGCRFVPQYDYLFDVGLDEGDKTPPAGAGAAKVAAATASTRKRGEVQPKRMVEHVLRFENLQDDFDALARQYRLNLTMPPKGKGKVNARKVREGAVATLTVDDMNDETVELINEVYGKDFEYFEYLRRLRTGVGQRQRSSGGFC